MSFVQSALEKMAIWMHHVSSGGSPLGVLHLAQGAKDDLAKAAAEFVGADPADSSAGELNAGEAASHDPAVPEAEAPQADDPGDTTAPQPDHT